MMFCSNLIYIVGMGLPVLDEHIFADHFFTPHKHPLLTLSPQAILLRSHRRSLERRRRLIGLGVSSQSARPITSLSYVGTRSHTSCRSIYIFMNFYFEAVSVLDKLDAKKGSIKGVLASVPEKNRKRTAALVIETLKCEQHVGDGFAHGSCSHTTDKQVLQAVIDAAQLLKQEKKLASRNLALVLVHDFLLAGGIQAGDGPIKQAVLRHRTRLSSEFTRAKIKRGAKSNEELAQTGDSRAGTYPCLSIESCSEWEFVFKQRSPVMFVSTRLPGRSTKLSQRSRNRDTSWETPSLRRAHYV